ncbi:MarR family transcriptional regulator [Microbacterium album]|uniref:MarR family transcriptional regulator n=1 Tax=Microbacterium album TaxID=2053191 RepID=A0A917IFS7_9MICO|nr:MarR family transcriptional regulator [Microbacterium album]
MPEEVAGNGLRPPFHSLVARVADKAAEGGEDDVVPRLSMMMRKLSQLMSDDATQRVYRPRGWSHAGYRICVSLWVMGPMPSHQVTAMTNMGRATVSAALKRICDIGLVTKEPLEQDGRSVMVRLTPLGEQAIRESYAAHLAIEHEWFDMLTDVEKLVLLMLLEKLMTGRNGY